MYNIQLFGFAIKKAVWQKENNCIYAFDKLEKQPFKKKIKANVISNWLRSAVANFITHSCKKRKKLVFLCVKQCVWESAPLGY